MRTEDAVQYIGHVINAIIDGSFRRSILAVIALIPVQLLGLDTYALLGLFVMLFLDWVTGITKSKLNNETITSGKMSRTVLKATMYFSFLIASFIVTRVYPDYTFLHTFSLSFIILIEFKSIIENLIAAKIVIPPPVRKWLSSMLNIDPTKK